MQRKIPSATWADTNWKAVMSHIYRGFMDAIHLPSAVDYFVKSDRLQKLFVQCFLLNGAIFVGSIIVLDYLAAPAFMRTFSTNWNNGTLNETMTNMTSPSSSVDFVKILFAGLKNFFWIYPLYGMSFLFNSLWYGDVAKVAYEITEKRNRRRQLLQQKGTKDMPSHAHQQSGLFFRRALVDRITDLIYLNILLLFFTIQQTVATFIPVVGTMLEFLTFTWYSAFYSFQYLWSYKSEMNLQKQLEYFERHWAYMLGFGAPSALASYFFPFFINAGIWAMIFPLFIVLAIRSSPPPVNAEMPPLHVFHYAKKISGVVIGLFSKISSQPQPKQSVKFTLPSQENEQ